MAKRNSGGRPVVGLIWSQFSAYHVDRSEAAARRLAGCADVWSIEVATTSRTYAWSPSGAIEGARKITVFPNESYESIGLARRFWQQFKVLRHCDVVFVGISYAEVDMALLAFCLRALGVRMVMMTDSKFDDRERRIGKELLKPLVFLPYSGVIVAGLRQTSYMRFLGYRRRRVLTGYDSVNLARVLAAGGGIAAPHGREFGERPFVFVGRFVAKKNIAFMIAGFKRYTELAGAAARRLLLVGSGELEPDIRSQIAALGLVDRIELTGFLQADGVARILADGLALVLVSKEEQWGLVVNEALAFNLPVIVSENVGARDLLVRNLVNGYVIESGSVDGLARAMFAMAQDEAGWRAMVEHSRALAPAGHTDRFADAVSSFVGPGGGADTVSEKAEYQ